MKWFPFVRRRRLKVALAERDAALAALDRIRREYGDASSRSVSTLDKFKYLAPVFNMNSSEYLAPIGVSRNHAEWREILSSDAFAFTNRQDSEIVDNHRFEKTWGLAGYSASARKAVVFNVDMIIGGWWEGDEYHPNLRESVSCPITGLNNRQRLMAALVERELSKENGAGIAAYCMEQVTPFFKWATDRFPNVEIFGSEFLGEALNPGQIVDGIRHEDIQDLSFDDASLGLVISNDVMEHVPSPRSAFTELARVMREGSQALMTFPFFPDCDRSVTRAEIVEGAISHLREPVYHGNPVSSDGSLVYTDFGWDLFDLVRECGFKDISLEIYHSVPFGHLGLGIVFRLVR